MINSAATSGMVGSGGDTDGDVEGATSPSQTKMSFVLFILCKKKKHWIRQHLHILYQLKSL